MGVWIEMEKEKKEERDGVVTPCVGVWIEIKVDIVKISFLRVTPCVGVWIEITGIMGYQGRM